MRRIAAALPIAALELATLLAQGREPGRMVDPAEFGA
jgi:hypothetical protein